MQIHLLILCAKRNSFHCCLEAPVCRGEKAAKIIPNYNARKIIVSANEQLNQLNAAGRLGFFAPPVSFSSAAGAIIKRERRSQVRKLERRE